MDPTTMDLRYPTVDELQLVEILHALGDPIRLQIVQIVAQFDGNVACADMGLPVTKSTGSHHYKVLREAGVLACREEGTRRFYSLRRAELDARFPGLLDSVLTSG